LLHVCIAIWGGVRTDPQTASIPDGGAGAVEREPRDPTETHDVLMLRAIFAGALAEQADPLVRQSDIVRFRFRLGLARAQNGQELPETEFGELLFERETGRCVYRYWYDAVEGPMDSEIEPDDRPEGNEDPRDHGRMPLKGAAGFDGERYWAASYSPFKAKS